MSPLLLAAPLSATVVVERTADAVACPSAELLTTRLEATVGRPLHDERGDRVLVRVAFSRSTSGYEASVSLSGAREGERQLRDTGATCEALADAVVVTTALLFDQAAEPQVTAEPPAAAKLPERQAALPAAATERERIIGLWLGARFGAGLGMVGGPTWLASGAFGVSLGRFTSLQLGAGMSGATERAFGTGTIRVQLRLAELSAFRSLTGDHLQFGPSLALLAGVTTGTGSGYPTSTHAELPWFALGGGVRTEVRFGRVAISLRALVLVPTQRQAFSVGYAGVGYESSAVAGLAEGGAALRFW